MMFTSSMNTQSFCMKYLLLGILIFLHPTLRADSQVSEQSSIQVSEEIASPDSYGKYVSWNYVFGPIHFIDNRAHHWLVFFSGVSAILSLILLIGWWEGNNDGSFFTLTALLLTVSIVVIVWIFIVVPIIWIYRILEQIIWRRLIRKGIKRIFRHRFWRRKQRRCQT